jgi:hypothetical protein
MGVRVKEYSVYVGGECIANLSLRDYVELCVVLQV